MFICLCMIPVGIYSVYGGFYIGISLWKSGLGEGSWGTAVWEEVATREGNRRRSSKNSGVWTASGTHCS